MIPATSATSPPRLLSTARLNLGVVLLLSLTIHRAHGWTWFNDGKIPHIRIEIAEQDMDTLRGYRWQWGGDHQDRPDVSVTVREGSTVHTNVQLHLKGAAGSFRPVDERPALTLNFSKNAKGQKFHGLEKLSLNNSVQDSSYLCEVLARELFNAAGVPTPRAAHATVTLNGRRLGLYVLVEGWNKAFLKQHFANPKGNLYDGGFGQDVDRRLNMNSGDDDSARVRLDDLARAARSSDATNRLQALREVLDVDRFFTFAAMEILLTHVDGYCIGHNNYRIYHDPESDRLVFMPHGMDQLFGTFKSTPDYTLTPSFKSIVSQGVMGARGGRTRYLQRVGNLYTNHFLGGSLTSRVDELAAQLLPVLQRSPQAVQRWQNSVEALKRRIQRRIESVGTQLHKPRKPMSFETAPLVLLNGWGFRRGSSGQGEGQHLEQEGRGLLTIAGPAQRGSTWPSWRRSVLLDRGRYQLKATVRLESLPGAVGDPIPAIALRMSGARSGYPRTVAGDWSELIYKFTLEESAEVELLCELRGTLATAMIQADSLKLLRIDPDLE